MSHAAPLRDGFHAAILHPDEASILLLEDGQAWKLPELQPEDNFTQVAQINEAMRARFGLDTVVLRCLDYRTNREAGRDESRVNALFSLEAQALGRPPDGGRWVGRQELRHLRLTRPEQRDVLEQLLREDADSSLVPTLRPPWARRGWFKEAGGWVQGALSQAGREMAGPLEQVKQWSITSLSRVPTERGYVYFKAVPPLFAGEPGITQALAELFSDAVPRPLATDRARGWMLLDDFGGQTLQKSGLARWPEVMRRFAELQVAAVEHRDTLLAAGCMDRRLERLEEGLTPLLTEAGELQDLTAEERVRLGALEPPLRAMIDRLKSYAVPETLLHGDFHSNNVALADDRVIFFDWTDGAIGHPFFDLMPLVYLQDATTLTPEGSKAMLDAYLQPWTVFEPASRLHEAVDLALTLSLLHHAVSYDAIRRGQEEGARWELGGTTAYLLRTLLERMPSS